WESGCFASNRSPVRSRSAPFDSRACRLARSWQAIERGGCPERAQRAEGHTRMNDTRPAFVYVLQCADESFYVGVTFDVHARLSTHNTGRSPGYTATRLPVKLVHVEPSPSMAAARQRERQIKR